MLFADDPRPLPRRLTHEARRILLAAAITLGVLALLVVAGLAALIWLLA